MANKPDIDLESMQDTSPFEWPSGTDSFLLSALKDGKLPEKELKLAVGFAGDMVVVNDDLARELLRLVGDPKWSEALRAHAAVALGPALEDVDTMDDEAAISESVFEDIQATLRKWQMNADVPKLVRRRILESSVRASKDWHTGAVRAAYVSGDDDWKLTAAFCMRFIQGFNKEILVELDSKDAHIHFEAVRAAGAREIGAAWDHVVALARSNETEKELRLAAIEAVGCIHPDEAEDVLSDVADSSDDEIAEAALEAISMADAVAGFEDEDQDDEEAEDDSDEDE